MIIEVTGSIVIDMSVRTWCTLPYPGHPKGCPNFGISDTCPPKVKTVSEIFDLEKQHWFAVVEFNLKNHADRMKMLHPAWSQKQCTCCLYWQNGVRKQLRKLCDDFIFNKSFLHYTLIPEAMGVNVFQTARRYGVTLTKDITDKLYKIALIGNKHGG